LRDRLRERGQQLFALVGGQQDSPALQELGHLPVEPQGLRARERLHAGAGILKRLAGPPRVDRRQVGVELALALVHVSGVGLLGGHHLAIHFSGDRHPLLVRQRPLAAAESLPLDGDLGGDLTVRDARFVGVLGLQRAGDLGPADEPPHVLRHAHAEPVDSGPWMLLRTRHAQDHGV
jgi:hypothetical protein